MVESYYRDLATLCAERVESTKLAKVIDRCRRSEAAWLAMAERAARHTQLIPGP
jgi:hypothetical protein